jgi:S-adenosylmethionine synthetase
MSYQFTSESVSEGHPDKVADQISDAILDAYLSQDSEAKVACEVLITTGKCIIAGEVRSNAQVDPVAVAKRVLNRIGYNNPEVGFDLHTASFENLLHQQSPEIFAGVVDGGAGDQGIMFGYATNETPEYLPLPIALSHRIVKELARLRHEAILPWLRPDAKSQVTVRYENGKPVGIDGVIISTQHDESVTQDEIRKALIDLIVLPIVAPFNGGLVPLTLVNPSGSFIIGGPHGDTGLTGRKIIVDTYGGRCEHGGGAFSGKDPSKVDRSAAYAARYVAKQVVSSGRADWCKIQLSYAIGVAEPQSIYVETDRDAATTEAIRKYIEETFDLTPNGIIKTLDLKRPIYEPTASYGHFGRPEFPWEG